MDCFYFVCIMYSKVQTASLIKVMAHQKKQLCGPKDKRMRRCMITGILISAKWGSQVSMTSHFNEDRGEKKKKKNHRYVTKETRANQIL